MRNVFLILPCLLALLLLKGQSLTPSVYEYRLQQELGRGWNTWDTYSQVNYVHLPEGISINLALKEYQNGWVMKDPLTNRREQHMVLGGHSDNGSYTGLEMDWENMRFRIQTATDKDNLVILITPLEVIAYKKPVVIAAAGMLWQNNGSVSKSGDHIQWTIGNQKTTFYSTDTPVRDPDIKINTCYNVYQLNKKVGFSTGKFYSLTEIEQIIDRQNHSLLVKKQAYDSLSLPFDIIQSSIAWNTIYEPMKRRVITPVSRAWSVDHGGYVLFEWDNYFASYMASLYNKNLAYANAIAITNEITENGFVPNFADALMKSRDRSEPPVGSFCVREIYRRYKEKWFLSLLYNKLLKWNRWWAEKRELKGLLVWGSNDYNPVCNNYWERKESGVNQRQGASFESGMDNAPMYFNIPFDSTSGLLQLWDVGLNSLYIQDCSALADIARILNKMDDYKELVAREKLYTSHLNWLWDEKTGIYRNKRVDNGSFSDRISPTSFYSLLTDAPDKEKADRMMKEHFFNPDEFFGEWMLPSVPRNDTSFKAQDYWQGRIWAPLNFLVYLGLRKHHLTEAGNVLIEKSGALLLKNWKTDHLVCENYNSITGTGGEKGVASDPYYFWGALLGFMKFIDKGYIEAPEQELH
jgi:hypothetical protein